MKPIAILAIGQGGASVATEFAKLGFRTGALNTSPADLKAVEKYIPHALLLPSNGGAGKDRALGLQAVVDSTDRIADFLVRTYDDKALKVLLVIYSLGGGTGSGGGPTVAAIAAEVLPHLIVNPVVILPDNTESDAAKINMVQAFADVSRLEGIGGTFVFDNEKARVWYTHAGSPGVGFYQFANRAFAEVVFNVLQIPEVRVSTTSNFDHQELYSLLAEPGMIGIFQVALPKSDWDHPTLLDRAYRHSVFPEPAQPRHVGIIVEAPPATADWLAQQIQFDPEPLLVHRGLYYADPGRLSVIAAGSNWPTERMKAAESSVVDAIERAKRPIEAYRPTQIESPFGFRRNVSMPHEEPRARAARVLEKLRKKE